MLFNSDRWKDVNPDLRSRIELKCMEVATEWPSAGDLEKTTKIKKIKDGQNYHDLRGMITQLPTDLMPSEDNLLTWANIVASYAGRRAL